MLELTKVKTLSDPDGLWSIKNFFIHIFWGETFQTLDLYILQALLDSLATWLNPDQQKWLNSTQPSGKMSSPSWQPGIHPLN